MTEFTDLLAALAGHDEARAEDAARRLAGHGESILPALESLLASPEPDERWWAVRTLAAMPAPRTDWLRLALGDESSDVRAAAALALVAHPVEAAGPELVQALQDEDSIVAVLAVQALVAIGAAAVPLERIEDYIAAAAADDPLVPDLAR